MREEEVLACSFDRWYPDFKDITFRSCIIPLPEEFVSFLMADGINIPATDETAISQTTGNDSDSEWGDGGSDSETGDQDMTAITSSVAEIESKITESIANLGGSVLPKLNWSAPKDARWIFGSLKCRFARDVFTLLKASDFVAHDLCHSFDHCKGNRTRPDQFSLILRRWYDLEEAGEYRCFVDNRRLLAACQRNTSVHFPFLCDLDFKSSIMSAIVACFQKYIRDGFALGRYTFDVFVGKKPRFKVSLIDFSPWGATTDPLLFDWEELKSLADCTNDNEREDLPELRVIGGESEVRSRIENYHALPLEVAQLGGYSTDEVEDLCRRAQAGISSQQG